MKYNLKQFGDLHSCTFSKFCDHFNLDIMVEERSIESDLPRYFAYLNDIEVMEGGSLISVHADGFTPEKAIEVLAHRLRSKRLVYCAFSEKRKEIVCPNEFKSE